MTEDSLGKSQVSQNQIQACIMDCKAFWDNFALERIVVSPSPFISDVEYFVMTCFKQEHRNSLQGLRKT